MKRTTTIQFKKAARGKESLAYRMEDPHANPQSGMIYQQGPNLTNKKMRKLTGVPVPTKALVLKKLRERALARSKRRARPKAHLMH